MLCQPCTLVSGSQCARIGVLATLLTFELLQLNVLPERGRAKLEQMTSTLTSKNVQLSMDGLSARVRYSIIAVTSRQLLS